MDITDAFNELLFAAKCHDGSPGYALWDFFRPEDAFLLRKFIWEECGFGGPGDPIHSQSINFTPDLRERAFKKYGICPMMIRQYAGDIVFIPAYCAHQVIFTYLTYSQLIHWHRLPIILIVSRWLATWCLLTT
jgi:lysine-specific demethylase 3